MEWQRRGGLVRFVVVALFLSIFVGVGLFNISKGARDVWSSVDSGNWPTTKAKIISSKVESKSGSGRRGGTTYLPEVVYRYQIAGAEYTSMRIYFGGIRTSNSSLARQYVSKYKKGDTVEIRYDTRNPAEAVIEPGLSKRTFAPIVFGLVFFTVGSGCMAAFWLRWMGGEAGMRKLPWVYGIFGGVMVFLLILLFGVAA